MLLLIKWHGVQDFKEDDDGIWANLITSFYDFGNKTVGKYQVSCSNNLFSAKQIIYLPVWHFLLPVFLERILKMCLWIWPLHSAHYLSHNKNICFFFQKYLVSNCGLFPANHAENSRLLREMRPVWEPNQDWKLRVLIRVWESDADLRSCVCVEMYSERSFFNHLICK